MPTVAHFIYIPVMLMLGVVQGYFFGNRAAQDAMLAELHLALRVETREDIDLWAAHLDALGVKRAPIHETSEPVPHALIVFRDPDEIQLEVMWFGA